MASASFVLPEILGSCAVSHASRSSKTGLACSWRNTARSAAGLPLCHLLDGIELRDPFDGAPWRSLNQCARTHPQIYGVHGRGTPVLLALPCAEQTIEVSEPISMYCAGIAGLRWFTGMFALAIHAEADTTRRVGLARTKGVHHLHSSRAVLSAPSWIWFWFAA